MKDLKFIHITKCAGTSIENAGKKQNILWGRFHKEYGFWHKLFPKVDPDVINKYDWFMVVRNPYERMLSEYYWFTGRKKQPMTRRQMNKFLIDKIKKRSNVGDHFTEQYKYLYPFSTIHVLKFESLDEEFSELMKLYGLEAITLPVNNVSENKNYSVSDFSDKLIRLINEIYYNDFIEFQYDMIQPYSDYSYYNDIESFQNKMTDYTESFVVWSNIIKIIMFIIVFILFFWVYIIFRCMYLSIGKKYKTLL
jgi:hypothetical protein